MTSRSVLLGLASVVLALSAAWSPRAGAAPPADRSTLRVYAAASLAEAFDELGHVLELRRPGLKVRMSFAGSQQLASQLVQGARADVFAAADARSMQDVKDHGLLERRPELFACNRMVVIVPGANPARIMRPQDLARAGVKLVVCAEAVPAGRYSRDVLRNLAREAGFERDFAARTLKNVVSEEDNVRAVLAKVQLGEADAGIVYRSDVSAKLLRRMTVLAVPAAANVLAEYPIAVLKDARATEAARAFVDLVLSAEGQQILARHGFLPVGSSTR